VGVTGNTNNNFSYVDQPSNVLYSERRSSIEADFTIDVYRGLYVGVNYLYRDVDFRFDQGTPEEQEYSERELRAAGAEKTIDSGIGLVVLFDNRDNEYAPTNGVFANVDFLNFEDWLGSDNNYNSTDTIVNTYWSFEAEHILAFRFRWRTTSGDVPFSGQSQFGGIDLRAYPTGKYRGAGMLAGQLEYRFPIYTRLRGVAFAGTGRVYGEDLTLGANQVLPSGGGGIRFLLLEDRELLVGLDVAFGRFGNRGVYFSFGEAF
jgi:outer membrane protein assembly factor BamA